jgi:uncharacterized small protein (DUF1192 family)
MKLLETAKQLSEDLKERIRNLEKEIERWQSARKRDQ